MNRIKGAEEVIMNLSEKIDKVLSGLIPAGSTCALVDFPNHPNAGDSAIWLGETTWLRKNKIKTVYFCDKETYNQKTLAGKLGNGIILLHGGGNFGDVWPEHQAFREKVIKDFPKNKIIQLPQTVHFHDKKKLSYTKKILDRHPDFTLLCRDRRSLSFVRKEFKVTSTLCPDMAFCLGSFHRVTPPRDKIVWLSRTDKETSNKSIPESGNGIIQKDWLGERENKVVKLNQEFSLKIKFQANDDLLYKSLAKTYDQLAKQRIHKGCKILCEGRVVVTDRLHGHILSLLMGIPHILLDNSYGKVRGFYNLWTKDNSISIWAHTPEEVITKVLPGKEFTDILKRTGNLTPGFQVVLKQLKNSGATWISAEENNAKQWEGLLNIVRKDIRQSMPTVKKFILVDEDQLRLDLNAGTSVILPFIESEKNYFGPPVDDDTAIKECKRMRDEGAEFLVIAWPAFWWIKYYNKWYNYLESNFNSILKNDRIQIFDMKIDRKEK